MSNAANNIKFKEAFDRIEPAEGAKERMMKNIEKKSAEQSAQPVKSTKTTRILRWAMPVAACLIVAAVCLAIFLPKQNQAPVAAGTNDDTLTYAPILNPGGAQLPNPMEPVAEPDAFGEKVGVPLEVPEQAINAECYIIGDNIAQISFLSSEDSHEYTLRGSKLTEDISGLYGEAEEAVVIDQENLATLVTLHSGDETYIKVEWHEDDKNFVLMNTDGASAAQITAVYNAIK